MSRDHGPSSLDVGGESVSTRAASSKTLTTNITPRYPRKTGPMGDWVKLWTELNTPERVMNVPRSVRRKVAITSVMVQPFRCSRRSITMLEWMNAVAVSQGIKLAFSTGSHAQYPPQPRTS